MPGAAKPSKRTTESAIGFGRTGARVAKMPRRSPSKRGDSTSGAGAARSIQ